MDNKIRCMTKGESEVYRKVIGELFEPTGRNILEEQPPTNEVYCVFRACEDYSLWKIFSSKEKAENWIKEHGNQAIFEIEKWTVR